MRFFPEDLTLPEDQCAVCQRPNPQLSVRLGATGFLKRKILTYKSGGSW